MEAIQVAVALLAVADAVEISPSTSRPANSNPCCVCCVRVPSCSSFVSASALRVG